MLSWSQKLENLTRLSLVNMLLNVVFSKVRISIIFRLNPASIVFAYLFVYIDIVCLFVYILYIKA